MSGCKRLKTILLDKTGLNLLISVKLQRTVNEKKRENLATRYKFTFAACRKRQSKSLLYHASKL